jgi:hypothetical protein
LAGICRNRRLRRLAGSKQGNAPYVEPERRKPIEPGVLVIFAISFVIIGYLAWRSFH